MKKLAIAFCFFVPIVLAGCLSSSRIDGATTSATVDRLEEGPTKTEKQGTIIRIIPRGNQ